MVDFSKLGTATGSDALVDPRDIFQTLPRPQGVGDLYASQAEVLAAWFAAKDQRKDIVVKQPTGGGKTLIGLLIATSIMNERKKPVLFLAPTRQLVVQIEAEARKFGLPAVSYLGGSQSLPREFLQARAIGVATYKALFNGKSRFGLRGGALPACDVGGIICDDAHAAFDIVRSSFSVAIVKEKNAQLYEELALKFQPCFAGVGMVGTFEDVFSGRDDGVIEVPYWAWCKKIEEVRHLLSASNEVSSSLEWPLVRDDLIHCHALISPDAVTITPLVPLVEKFPTFSQCPQRVFMSATISDDSELVRTFGVSSEAASNPATSKSLAGVGERMILIPDLMNLAKNESPEGLVQEALNRVNELNLNALILVPSKRIAAKWTGKYIIPKNSEEVDQLVARLQAGEKLGTVLLVNRYDGIDLANDACRVLVMSGMPIGTSDYEKFRSSVLAGAALNATLAQRIEQGIGRGSRGGGDFCVVILLGNDLVSWLGRGENEKSLTNTTRKQIEVGMTVSNAVRSSKEFLETINQSLQQDQDWKRYYAAQMASASRPVEPYLPALQIAEYEVNAFDLLRQNRFQLAIDKYAQAETLIKDTHQLGWILQLRARALFLKGNETGASSLQAKAHSTNRQLCRAPTTSVYQRIEVPSAQAEEICSRLQKFTQHRAALAFAEEVLSPLSVPSSSNRYEEAVRQLGLLLGFNAERPDNEFGVGPDVFWSTPSEWDFVIEVKSNKKAESHLRKDEHGQLLVSVKWHASHYPGRQCRPFIIHPNKIATEQAAVENTDLITLAGMVDLANSTKQFIRELGESDLEGSSKLARCEELLRYHKITPQLIVSERLSVFESGGS